MKLNINKACDLNSISVLPPHSRRSNVIPQQQHPRSQPSQQSFSQGISSHSQQNGLFSQGISQNSLDDFLTDHNIQKFGSQEKDNPVRRLSSLPPLSYPREDSQMPMPRSSSSLARRWSSAAVPEQKCQLSDAVEQKFSMMETILNRLGKILDSVQTDIMQVNKGTKELSLEVEGICQKSIAHCDSLHQLIRAQEDTKASLESISNHLRTIMQQDKIQEILSAVSDLQEQIDTNYLKQNDELSKCLSGDLQDIRCSLKTLHQNMPLAMLPHKVTGADSFSQNSFMMSEVEQTKALKQAHPVPKLEMESWSTDEADQTVFSNQYGSSCWNPKQRKASLDREHNVCIELDDETDEDLSCLSLEKESDKHTMDEMEEDVSQILRKARRRKRKQDCKSLMNLPQATVRRTYVRRNKGNLGRAQ